MKKSSEIVFEYHNNTKHLPFRYAASPAGMDWATQPDPYRRYEGTEVINLPLVDVDPTGGYNELFSRAAKPRPFDLNNIAAFLELSMGLAAVKTFMDSSWALRINPSSGNLHPTEAYIIRAEETPSRGIFHYNSEGHILEKRAELSTQGIEGLNKTFRGDGFLTLLTGIDWREAWKYGARAFRYSNLDTGHAAAALSFSAALLGWKITHLNNLSDHTLRGMLGFDDIEWTQYEAERVEAAFLIEDAGAPSTVIEIDNEIIEAFKALDFKGKPNTLSSGHIEWPMINEVVRATEKKGALGVAKNTTSRRDYIETDIPAFTGASVIRNRRSAQAYKKDTEATREEFFSIIDRTIPRTCSAPFDLLHNSPQINLIIFIHRVKGLKQGLYILLRDENEKEGLKEKMNKNFLWKETELQSLYLLMEGDLTEEARYIFCQQDLAGNAVFAAAMIARFRDNIVKNPSSYRDLFMEAGIVGQVLYIAAEAHGLRGTGIGCFYDDMIHELIGFPHGDNTYQSLYHFTVGSPLRDSRITTALPYGPLRRK